MQIISRIFITIILTLWFTVASGTGKGDPVRFEILMSSQMLQTVNLSPDFINAIDVTPERHVLLSGKDQFYLLGWGGIKALGKKIETGTIKSFAFSYDSLLMAVRDNEICYFDAGGTLMPLIKLPGSEMGISAGKKAMYIYDRSTTPGNKGVYMLLPGGQYAVIFEVSTPVTSVAQLNNDILFTSGNMVCRFIPETKEYKILATLSAEKKILSVTADQANNRIYFSTDRAIYAVNDSSAITLSDMAGGIVRFFDDGLLIFDPEKKFLVRIAGIEEELRNLKKEKPAEVKELPSKILSNAKIAEMVKAGMSDALIITVIKKSAVDFDTSINGMISLTQQGVSSAVIMEMRKAMQERGENTQNK